MIFSNWPFVIDLRSGAFSGGGGEIALMHAASAQLSNWLGLVRGVASPMTDSKAIDAQYGAEKGVTALAAALSGANMIYESAGMTAALLGVSFEGFVLDNDMLGNIYRMLQQSSPFSSITKPVAATEAGSTECHALAREVIVLTRE